MQIDSRNVRRGRIRELLVLLVDDCRDVWHVHPPVALGGNVEWQRGVLRESVKEQLEERVNVRGCDRCVADGAVAVGIPDVNGLVEEDDVRVGVPAIRVRGGGCAI